MAGSVLPRRQLRGFGTCFFKRECELLALKIERSDPQPANGATRLGMLDGAALAVIQHASHPPGPPDPDEAKRSSESPTDQHGEAVRALPRL